MCICYLIIRLTSVCLRTTLHFLDERVAPSNLTKLYITDWKLGNISMKQEGEYRCVFNDSRLKTVSSHVYSMSVASEFFCLLIFIIFFYVVFYCIYILYIRLSCIVCTTGNILLYIRTKRTENIGQQ